MGYKQWIELGNFSSFLIILQTYIQRQLLLVLQDIHLGLW